jgi:hypothetical protein
MGMAFSCINFKDLKNDDGKGKCLFCGELTDRELTIDKIKHYMSTSEYNYNQMRILHENKIKFICRKRGMVYNENTYILN